MTSKWDFLGNTFIEDKQILSGLIFPEYRETRWFLSLLRPIRMYMNASCDKSKILLLALLLVCFLQPWSNLSLLCILDDQHMDGHSDFCAVCNNCGDLLCCDLCCRAYHVGCIYPPIRKFPKGDWSCQMCTGADSDLPKSRRVATLERKRGIIDRNRHYIL